MKTLIALILSILLSSGALAQSNDDLLKNTQTDLMIVAGAGAAGAIIGLSTLSFVDTPSRHVSNIWTGAALGVIAGVIFVAYSSATKNSEDLQSSASFNTSERLAWHSSQIPDLTFQKVHFGTQIWGTNF